MSAQVLVSQLMGGFCMPLQAQAQCLEECNYKGVNSSLQVKLPNDMLYGTYVNLSSPLLMHVTAIGSKTLISRLELPSNDLNIMSDYNCIRIIMPTTMVIFLFSLGLALGYV